MVGSDAKKYIDKATPPYSLLGGKNRRKRHNQLNKQKFTVKRTLKLKTWTNFSHRWIDNSRLQIDRCNRWTQKAELKADTFGRYKIGTWNRPIGYKSNRYRKINLSDLSIMLRLHEQPAIVSHIWMFSSRTNRAIFNWTMFSQCNMRKSLLIYFLAPDLFKFSFFWQWNALIKSSRCRDSEEPIKCCIFRVKRDLNIS